MELKEYQVSALGAFVRWRDALASAQVQSETAIAAWRQSGPDSPEISVERWWMPPSASTSLISCPPVASLSS